MEIVNTHRSLSDRRMEKLDKKVTWKENLTDVKIMTPQASVFHNLREIVFCEEDEDAFTKDTWEYKPNAIENHKDDEKDKYLDINDQNCFNRSKEDMSNFQNNETPAKRNLEEERKRLDRSLQQIFANVD